MIRKYSIIQDDTDSIYAVFSDSIVLSHLVSIVESENGLVPNWKLVKVLANITVETDVVSFENNECVFKIKVKKRNDVLYDNIWVKRLTHNMSSKDCYLWLFKNINEMLIDTNVMENIE